MVHRPESDTTSMLSMREHLPRTSHVRFPGVIVLTRLSSGTVDPAVRVFVVHETRWTTGEAADAAEGDAMRATVIVTMARTVATLRRRMFVDTSIRICNDIAGRTRMHP